MTSPICREVTVLSLEREPVPVNEGGTLHTLRLSAPGWKYWEPGQFVMLRPKERGNDLVWARPFSICHSSEHDLTLFFQVAGRGTELLTQVRTGEALDIWGPLGNGFSVSKTGPTLLLAGGIGIAPFVGYIARHPTPETLRMDFGHRFPLKRYPFTACSAVIAARSHHERGPDDLHNFINVLSNGIKEVALQNGLVLACGPQSFLRTVHSLALAYGARTQLSLENRMACGVGACLGCVVKGKRPVQTSKNDGGGTDTSFFWMQTCTCGPVFWAEEITLDS